MWNFRNDARLGVFFFFTWEKFHKFHKPFKSQAPPIKNKTKKNGNKSTLTNDLSKVHAAWTCCLFKFQSARTWVREARSRVSSARSRLLAQCWFENIRDSGSHTVSRSPPGETFHQVTKEGNLCGKQGFDRSRWYDLRLSRPDPQHKQPQVSE